MKNNDISYVILYIFVFGAVGAFMPLLGQYLAGIGFSGVQIGTVTSSGTATAVAATVFWGRLYIGSGNKKRFVLKLAVMAAAVCFCLQFVSGYYLFLFVFCSLFAFQASVISLVDAMAVEDGRVFGNVRKWGAVGFALGVFFAGRIAEAIGLKVIFYLYSGFLTVFSGMLFLMSRADVQGGSTGVETEVEAETEKSGSMRSILSNKKYIKLVICAFFFGGTITANNTYFGFLFLQGGGSIAGIGLALLLMAGSEAPVMAYEKKLSDAFTLEKVLLAAMCVSALRFTWYSLEPYAFSLTALFFLQGMSLGIILVGFVRYIAGIVGSDNPGLAISAYYAFGSGLSTIFCQIIAGILLDLYGPGAIYRFFSCMNIVGIFLFVAWKLHRDK